MTESVWDYPRPPRVDVSSEHVVVGDAVLPAIAWTYPTPSKGFEQLVDHVALYPGSSTGAPSTARSFSPSPGTSTAAGSPHG